jgi:EmrB/QacA subfamily drug resistance transporter
MSAQKRWTMVAVILGSAIVFLDSTVVNVALPSIGRELPSKLFRTLEGQSLVYNGYLLSLSSLLILAGALADYHGRRRMFTLGLAGFGLTSVLCGAAPNLDLLIAFRVLQGAAGAMLVPGSLSIISSVFSGQEQGRAYGLWAAGSAATTIGGPFLGGILVDSVSWRAVFMINVPLVLVSLYATRRHVPESRDESTTGGFDWLGALVAAVAIGGLTFGLIRGQERGWTPGVFVILGAGILATAIFPWLMKRSPHPLVPLELFKVRNFAVINLATLVIWGALYITFYLASLFTQGTLGYSAEAAGIAAVPGVMCLVLFSATFGRLGARYGPRAFISAGPVMMGTGVLWLSRIPASSKAWHLHVGNPSSLAPPSSYLTDLLPGFVLFGLGAMMMVAPLTASVMASVPSSRSGLAAAINNAVARIGPQLAGALVFVAVTWSFYHGLAARLPGLDPSDPGLRSRIAPLNAPAREVPPQELLAAREASTDAFHLAMRMAAGLLITGGIINAVGSRNPEHAIASRILEGGAEVGAG